MGIFQKKKIESEWISHKSFENFFAKNVKGVISIEIQFLNIKKKNWGNLKKLNESQDIKITAASYVTMLKNKVR